MPRKRVAAPGDLSLRQPGALHPDTGATFARPHTRPRLVSLELGEKVVATGMPVAVSWHFEGARSVSVDGVEGHPAEGTTVVTLQRTRHVEVVGHNEIGSCTVRTPVVTVVPLPRIVSVSVPRMPAVHLHADVRASLAAAESVRSRLDRAMDAQDRFRPRTVQSLQPIGVPAHFVRWLASVPRVSFFRSSS